METPTAGSGSTLQFDSLPIFKNGIAIVTKQGKYGAIMTGGKEILPCVYDSLTEFDEGFAVARLNNDERIVNLSGQIQVIKDKQKIFLPDEYDWGTDYVNDVCIVIKNQFYGMIDRNFIKLLDCRYEYIESLSENLFKFRKDALWGLTDKTGKIITDAVYYNIRLATDQLIEVESCKPNGNSARRYYGILDMEGRTILPPDYKTITRVENGGNIFLIYETDSWIKGVINKNGEQIVPPIYKHISIHEDCISGLNDEYSGSYDHNGEHTAFFDDYQGITIPSEYEYALYVENGLMKVSKKGKWGLINLSGDVILEPVFDDIEEFDGSYAKVMIRKDDGHLYGMIDTAGEVILPIEYEHITKWENGYYVVSDNNSHSLLTPSLNVIIPHRDNYLRRLNDTYIIEGPALYGIRLLDYSGAEIIYDWPFVDVEIFENGMLKVIHTRSEHPGSSTIGIYANNGKLIYKKDYCDDITYIGNGLFLLKEYCYNYSLPGKYVYNVINLQGEEIFHINYEEIEVTKNWNFLIKKKGYYGKAKVSGEIFIQPKYINKIIFTQDTSEVKINDFDPAHKINMDGQLIVTDENQTEIVLDKDYYWGSDYIYGISIVRSLQTEALGVIDRDGNIILPPKYKHIDILSNQTIRVIGKSSLCTIFDLSGKCIRKYKPRTYDEIEDYILIGKDPYDDSAKIVYSDDLWDKEEYDEDDIEDYYPEYDEEE